MITLQPTEITFRPSQEIGVYADAQAAVEWLVHAERIVDMVKEKIADWVAINGPVEAAGLTAELRTYETWRSKDTHSLLKKLLSIGAKKEAIWDTISISEIEVKAILKKNKLSHLWDEIRELGETKETKRFGLFKSQRKKKDEDLPF